MPPRRRPRRGPVEDNFFREVCADEVSDLEMSSSSSEASDHDLQDPFAIDTEVDELGPHYTETVGEAENNSAESAGSGDERLTYQNFHWETSDDEFDGFTANAVKRVDRIRRNMPHHFEYTGSMEEFMQGWKVGSRPRQNLPFSGKTGLGQFIELPEDAAPVDYFYLFFQDMVFETMAEETNRYFHQRTDGVALKPRSRAHQWTDTNSDEMRVFVAMTIAMSLVVQRDITDYWSTHDVTQTPFFPKCMPRDRFWLLSTYFHVSNNALYPTRNSPAYSPINKLGTLYNNIVHRLSKIYIPHQHLSIDEGMVPWRGKLSFKVYNPDKPKKYGMKAYMLCDSHNGYVLKFQLYIGKEDMTDKAPSQLGKTFDLVRELMAGYRFKGYHVFMDNYYSSPMLYIHLWEEGIGATGTLRVTRKGTPPEMGKRDRGKKQEKHSIEPMHNKNLLVCRYMDKKPVVLLSSVEDTEPVDTGKRNRATGEAIMKPRILHHYNLFMGGVDRADQMLSYSPFKARTCKWWKRVWFHIQNVCLHDSFILYKETTKSKISSRQFRKEVVQGMIERVDSENVPSLRRRGRSRSTSAEDSIVRLHGRHFPSKIDGVGKKKNISRACIVCNKAMRVIQRKVERRTGEPSAKTRRLGRESSFQCVDCNACLCIEPCFRLYHSVVDYVTAYVNLYKKSKENTPDLTVDYSADNEENEDLDVPDSPDTDPEAGDGDADSS